MIILVFACAILALISAAFFAWQVNKISVDGSGTPEEVKNLKRISSAIAQGAMAFLNRQYLFVSIFATCFAVFMFFFLDDPKTKEFNEGLYSAIAFAAGALTSSICAYFGMLIATVGNVRTTVAARKGIGPAFSVAFRSGAVMGFGLCGFAVLGLIGIVLIYGRFIHEPLLLMEMVAGFGLGGSTVALFARVGGGIYTKAADVGADLVGKVEQGIPEDDPRNPAVIADNVGDNVGDIAGMGADLFGSCAEGTCAALVIGASAVAIAENQNALFFPILIPAIGIPVCLVTSFFARMSPTATSAEPALKRQLLISTILMTIAVYFVAQWAMVDSFKLGELTITRTGVIISILTGLWSGLLIGYVTEFYTSHSYRPTRELADSSITGSATNIIYGLAVGYESAVIPVLAVTVTTYTAWSLAGMYGIAMAAIGMISTLAIGLTIDAYGPVADNAGGIAEMSGLESDVRKRTDLLDAAGNTTAAIGKGFAIGSAFLTALALFAAFLTRVNVQSLNLLSPLVFAGTMVGGALPFLFTANTIKAVGRAANQMIEEVRRQFRTMPGIMEGTQLPDYRRCVAISTTAALRQMIFPGVLVMGSPILIGLLFGVEAVAGLLAGSLISGLVLALSSSNSGGAWDNAKKYIETGVHGGKGSGAHAAAVVGDTVGDPFKDTSGPSLNILMKLMAILSLVFAPFFVSYGGILLKYIGQAGQ